MGDDPWGAKECTAEDAIRRMRLLYWLADQPEGAHAILPHYLNKKLGAFIAGSATGMMARHDVQYLVAQGWIEAVQGWDDRNISEPVKPASTKVRITAEGRSKADRATEERDSKSVRVAACRMSVLWWLYSRDADDASRSLAEDRYFADRHSVYGGQQFSHGELLAALGWLHRKSLVTSTEPDGAQTPIQSYLTDAGLSCIERYDGEVDLYLESVEQKKPPDRAQSGPVINIHGGQVQMATGEYSQQTMNVGLAVEQLVLVIDGVAELLRTLGLDAGEKVALEKLQHDAVNDVRSERPSVQGVRRFYDWVLRCVNQGGSAALAAAVTAASNGMLHDAEQLAHAVGM
jgi:hypothetical protein